MVLTVYSRLCSGLTPGSAQRTACGPRDGAGWDQLHSKQTLVLTLMSFSLTKEILGLVCWFEKRFLKSYCHEEKVSVS